MTGFYLQWPDHATSLPDYVKDTDRIFSFFVWEDTLPPPEYFDFINTIPNPVTLILNSYNKHITIDSRCDTLFVDFFLYRSYREIVVLGKSAVNQQWNSKSDKFLFLTGKPDKAHRIGFLYALEQAGLDASGIFSLFVTAYNKSECEKILAVDQEEFERFVKKFQGSPDSITVPQKSVHYGGIPYNDKLFATKFRIISETHSSYWPAWITEKTWITILNRQPFLIAGDRESCKKLKNMGFKTFDQFLITPYDHIIDWKLRQSAILRNVKHWLETDLDMSADIEHNYHQLISLAKQNQQHIANYVHSVGIDTDIHNIVPTFDDITGQ